MKVPKNVTTRHYSDYMIVARQLIVSEEASPPPPLSRNLCLGLLYFRMAKLLKKWD